MSAAAPAEFPDSCRQKLLFGFQSGKLNRLPREVRKVVISSRGMAFSVARGTWGWGFRQSNQLFEPGYEAGGLLPGNALPFNERTNFDFVVLVRQARASLHPVNRFL